MLIHSVGLGNVYDMHGKEPPGALEKAVLKADKRTKKSRARVEAKVAENELDVGLPTDDDDESDIGELEHLTLGAPADKSSSDSEDSSDEGDSSDEADEGDAGPNQDY